MRRAALRLPLLLATAALAGCVELRAAEPPPGPPWLSERGREHPLAGRIWRPAEERFVTLEEALGELAGARFVLLGEKHDNPDHHRIQAWVLAQLIAGGRAPAVAFEMFTTAQQSALDEHLAAHPGDAAGLGPAVGWADSGWPDWSYYQPIAQAALDGGAPILPANLPRAKLREVSKEGIAALGPQQVGALGLERPMPAELRELMREEIIESHCRQLPESMIGPMVTVMATRDAFMADVLRRGAALPGRDGAVLIAGKGHARNDLATPYHLRRLAPGEAVVSLGLVEVIDDEADAAAYGAKFGAEDLPFDLVWFTARAAREDPCQAFAEQLRRAKEAHEREREAQ